MWLVLETYDNDGNASAYMIEAPFAFLRTYTKQTDGSWFMETGHADYWARVFMNEEDARQELEDTLMELEV